MNDKIEEPKKCSIHTEIFLVPSNYNPSIYVCPKCREERYTKAVQTRKKNEKLAKSAKELKKSNLKLVGEKVEIDFSDYMNIIESLQKSAKENFRTVESEILYTLNNVLNPKVE